ncbi:hypothetical protein LTR54_018117, partial [Friedmanniomyces endolithicus]
MRNGKQERAFDDDIAHAMHYKNVELKLIRNRDPVYDKRQVCDEGHSAAPGGRPTQAVT